MARAVFNDLQVVPIRMCLLATCWAPASSVFRHLPPPRKERLALAAFAIGRHERRDVWMPTGLQLDDQRVGNLLLGLSDRAADP